VKWVTSPAKSGESHVLFVANSHGHLTANPADEQQNVCWSTVSGSGLQDEGIQQNILASVSFEGGPSRKILALWSAQKCNASSLRAKYLLDNGEIDIVNGETDGASGILPTCWHLLISDYRTTVNTDCNWAANRNAGCGVNVDKANSYGSSFNIAGGG
ncbi:10682_t:CDS:2, partial [Acaulospora colombiana]